MLSVAEQLETAALKLPAPDRARLAERLIASLDVDEGRYFPALEEVVAEIKATPPDPSAFVPAKESLLEYLRGALPNESPIDSEAFDREWARIEADIDRRDRVDAMAEGCA